MMVYMLKDVENIGMAGTVVKVADGYGTNFLIPRKLAIKVAPEDIEQYRQKALKQEVQKEVINSKIGMVAERVKSMHITLKKRIHDDGKLYGSISADEIVDALKEKDVVVERKQIEFGKTIKSIGEHKVIVRFTSKIKPELTVKVVGNQAQ